jgi:hypothetical protein
MLRLSSRSPEPVRIGNEDNIIGRLSIRLEACRCDCRRQRRREEKREYCEEHHYALSGHNNCSAIIGGIYVNVICMGSPDDLACMITWSVLQAGLKIWIMEPECAFRMGVVHLMASSFHCLTICSAARVRLTVTATWKSDFSFHIRPQDNAEANLTQFMIRGWTKFYSRSSSSHSDFGYIRLAESRDA